jgi:hypothetical protein
MPLRGSVQLLLLSLRPRASRKAGIGAAIVVLVLLGAFQFREVLPSIGTDGLVQTFRQSLWAQALSGQSKAERWPWEDLAANMSIAPGAKVPRLGLSAALHKYETAEILQPAPPPAHRAQAKADKATAAQGDVALSDVKIGDSITFTAADGATCVYRVTGHRVVDPHLAESAAGPIDGAVSLLQCGPLESLIRQATQGAQQEPQAAPEPAADDQQKL